MQKVGGGLYGGTDSGEDFYRKLLPVQPAAGKGTPDCILPDEKIPQGKNDGDTKTVPEKTVPFRVDEKEAIQPGMEIPG